MISLCPIHLILLQQLLEYQYVLTYLTVSRCCPYQPQWNHALSLNGNNISGKNSLELDFVWQEQK